MYHPKRPTPLSYGIAGGICATGVIAIAARVANAYTDFTIVEPFDSLTFLVALVYAIAGPFLGAWLATQGLRRENAALRAQNAELLAERRRHDQLVEEIQKCDQQGEVNTVLLRKVLKEVEHRDLNADTVPIARLHSINGGGA